MMSVQPERHPGLECLPTSLPAEPCSKSGTLLQLMPHAYDLGWNVMGFSGR